MMNNYLMYAFFIVIGLVGIGYSFMYRAQVRKIERETGMVLNHFIRALLLIWMALSYVLTIVSTVGLLVTFTITNVLS